MGNSVEPSDSLMDDELEGASGGFLSGVDMDVTAKVKTNVNSNISGIQTDITGVDLSTSDARNTQISGNMAGKNMKIDAN
jgi:hypothetical protein